MSTKHARDMTNAEFEQAKRDYSRQAHRNTHDPAPSTPAEPPKPVVSTESTSSTSTPPPASTAGTAAKSAKDMTPSEYEAAKAAFIQQDRASRLRHNLDR